MSKKDIEKSDRTTCSCGNICNRSGRRRGACPCLSEETFCTDACNCGVAKIGCTNRPGHPDSVLSQRLGIYEEAKEEGNYGSEEEETDTEMEPPVLFVRFEGENISTVTVPDEVDLDTSLQELADNPKYSDSYGDTALHDAIGKDSKPIVELLVNFRGVDFTLRNKRGFNALHHAALKGNKHATEKILQTSRQLVDVKKDDGFCALHLAALNGHRDVAEILIKEGKAELDTRNSRQQSPLHLAVSQGHTPLIELLVVAGAGVNLEDEDGDTAIHIAMQKLNSFSVNLTHCTQIKELQAKLQATDDEVKNGFLISCFLVQHGSDLHHKNHNNRSPADLIVDQHLADLMRQSMPGKTQESTTPENQQECMVCSDAVANVTFEPCGHNIVCLDCCLKMKKCLACSETIEQKMAAGMPISSLPQFQKNQQIQELQRRVQEMEDTVICSICLENRKDTVFLCGHSACQPCAKPLKLCHMCRKPITKRINLFS